MRHLSNFLFGMTFLLMLSACQGSKDSDKTASAPLVAQAFSISANLQAEPPYANDAELIARYLDVRDKVEQLGVNGQFVSRHWAQLEPGLGNYPDDIWQSLEDELIDGRGRGFTQLFGLQLINTVTREVPTELGAVAWNSSEVLSAIDGLLARLLPLLEGRVRYLSVGNEVDVYFLNGRESEIVAYKEFFDHVQDFVHQHASGIEVGMTITTGAWLGARAAELLPLIVDNDVLISTFYMLDDSFSVLAPELLDVIIPAMIDFADGKPLVYQELGYPSSPVNDSSEALQAEFIEKLFANVRGREDTLPFFNLFLLHDFSDALVAEFETYYGLSDPKFISFLASLGLRNQDGSAKQAWAALEAAAAQF